MAGIVDKDGHDGEVVFSCDLPRYFKDVFTFYRERPIYDATWVRFGDGLPVQRHVIRSRKPTAIADYTEGKAPVEDIVFQAVDFHESHVPIAIQHDIGYVV